MVSNDARRARKTVPVRVGEGSNAARQRKALEDLSVCELETGHPAEYWDAIHREQRERVLRQYGVAL